MASDIMRGILWNLCFIQWFMVLVVFPDLDRKRNLEKLKRFKEIFSKVLTEEA